MKDSRFISLTRFKKVFSFGFGSFRFRIDKRVPIKTGKRIEKMNKAISKGELGQIQGFRMIKTEETI